MDNTNGELMFVQADIELANSLDHSKELSAGHTVLAFSLFECLTVVGEWPDYTILLLRQHGTHCMAATSVSSISFPSG